MKRALTAFFVTLALIAVCVKVQAALLPTSLNTWNVNGGLTNTSGTTNAPNLALIPGSTNFYGTITNATNVIYHQTTNFFYNTNGYTLGTGQVPQGQQQTWSGVQFVIPATTEIFALAFTANFAGVVAANNNQASNVVLNFDGSLDGVRWQSNVFNWAIPIYGTNLTTTTTNPAAQNWSGRTQWLYLGLNSLYNTNASGDLTNILLNGLTKPTL